MTTGNDMSTEDVIDASAGENPHELLTAQVEKQGKEKKVLIYKYNPKKHYHKKQGHRQPYTKLVIKDIKKTARKAKQEASEAAE